jgi:hypothetical protein
MTYETALDISFITRHRLAATLTPDTHNVFHLPRISLVLCMASHRSRVSLSLSLFSLLSLFFYISRFVLRLIDLTSI